MGKIYKGQTKLELSVSVGQDITGATSTILKYKKPSGLDGEFICDTINASNGVISYNIANTSDIDEAGQWVFWSYIVFVDGRIGIGEPFKVRVFVEGS